MTQASASKKPAADEIRGMHIEPADGGAVTEVRMKRPPRKGGVMAVSNLLRPIPTGVLDGYTDALTQKIAQQPDFVLWVEVYQSVLALPNVAAVLSHIKSRL